MPWPAVTFTRTPWDSPVAINYGINAGTVGASGTVACAHSDWLSDTETIPWFYAWWLWVIFCLHCTCVCVCVCVCPCACVHIQSITRKEHPCWEHLLVIIFGAHCIHRMGCQGRSILWACPKLHSQDALIFPSASFFTIFTSGRTLSSF